MKKLLIITGILAVFIFTVESQENKILIPQIDGEWWQIAEKQILEKYHSDDAQPVDFAIWQAADGTWQLWSCIRKTKCPCDYNSRLLAGWEGESLTDKNWKPLGIKMEADTLLGETPCGLQAPHVITIDQTYYMFYGDWRRICLAKSFDGKNFTRVLNGYGQPNLFTEHPYEFYKFNTARDPMVMKKGNTYYCYYTSHITESGTPRGAAYCRTSLDLKNWSESVMVSLTEPFKGNSAKYADECPHVIYLEEQEMYYLFVTQIYGKQSQTTVYASPNPMYFGINDERNIVCTLPVAAPEIIKHDGQWYIASTMPNYEGIHVAKLKWVEKK